MHIRHGLLAVALLAAATGAPALAAKPAASPFLTLIQPAEMRPGVTRRYRVETTVEGSGPDGSYHRRNVQTVDLTVVSVDDKGVKMRSTPVSIDAGADDAEAKAVGEAVLGIATEFEASASGTPIRVIGWPEERTLVLARLAANPAVQPDFLERVKSIVDGMDEEAAIGFAVPEARTIGGMQSWGLLQGFRSEEEPRIIGEGDQMTRVVAFREIGFGDAEGVRVTGGCEMPVRAVTEVDKDSPLPKTLGQTDRLETTAVISLTDGWVLSLTETHMRKLAARNLSELKTIKVTRLEDKPSCG